MQKNKFLSQTYTTHIEYEFQCMRKHVGLAYSMQVNGMENCFHKSEPIAQIINSI